MKKQQFIPLIVIFACLLMIIPAGFASDNITAGNDDILNGNNYYFDSNNSEDGNGTFENPYSSFSTTSISDNSNVYFDEGEYIFDKSVRYNNISFYGKDAQTTVLNGNGYTLTVNGEVSFNNITLTNLRIVNNANLTAFNTVFDELIPTSGSYDNSYGGAVYAQSNENIYINNCSFYNNSAQYGGAIYAEGGTVTIINSIFKNNTAFNYGGAISAQSKSKLIIRNSSFISDISTGDAGGAIYIISSSLDGYNLTFTDCSATFGSAVTSADSDLTLSDSSFKNNIASYEGGAIYQIFGTLNISSSEFINNTARNGGGLFIDNVTSCSIDSCEFINNTADSYAGAVYLLLSGDADLSNSGFEDNTAVYYDDIYIASTISLFIGNGNYSTYIYNLTSEESLPSYYNLNDYGYVTSVKNQEDGGNCWAFTALASLESCILKASGDEWDFSEENMKNIMSSYSNYGWEYYSPNDGGIEDMAVGYLVSWLGPVLDSDDAYDGESALSPLLNSLVHVQNVLYLKRSSYTDNDNIKWALMNYGAVATSMYYDSVTRIKGKYCHYYTGSSSPNHAVTIVGWDDTIKISNAPGNGAWIVKNSWGSSWGNNGYFYVSYYDTKFAEPGSYASYTFILNDTQHFDKNYQYDIGGMTDYFISDYKTVWYKNSFNATDNEFLSAVSTYFQYDNISWEMNIYINSILSYSQSGLSKMGYTTINFDYPLYLNTNDIFEVQFKINGDFDDFGFPISEFYSLNTLTYGEGVSFVSYDGSTWNDLYDLESFYPNKYSYTHSYSSQVACIKAFTQLLPLKSKITSLNIDYSYLNLFNITATVADENDNIVINGNVTFDINGKITVVKVNNGQVTFQTDLQIGENTISAVFNSPYYYNSTYSDYYTLSKISLDGDIAVTQYFNNADISITLSQPVNETLVISINGVEKQVKTLNGIYQETLTDLSYGNYNLEADLISDYYTGQFENNFFVDVKKTVIKSDNLETFYNSGVSHTIQLLDEFNNVLNNTQIEFSLNNKTFYSTTDTNGTVTVPINLNAGDYVLNIIYSGDEQHVNSTKSTIISIIPSKSSINLSNIVYDSFNLFNISVNVYDQLNQIINPKNLNITVNNIDYDSLNMIPFKAGENNISISFTDSNFYSSNLKTSYYAEPVVLDIIIDVIQSINSADIKFTLSQPVNETMSITINGNNNIVNATDGCYSINLTDLDYGNYSISSLLISDFFTANSSAEFFVNVKKTYFEIDNLTTVYNSGQQFTVILKDQFGKPVIGREIKLNINNNQYTYISDEEGKITENITLTDSIYQITAEFEGDELYIKSNASAFITVESSITIPETKTYTFNSNYPVYFLDKSGNPLTDTKITFTVNNVNYYVITDSEGCAIFKIPVKSGTVSVNVENPVTHEVKSQIIKIQPRLSENKNIVMYYGAGKYYKVRVLDDNGNAAKGVSVTFKINSKKYNVKTDNSGYALLKITLKSGKYTITATYKGFTVSNKITIKPTLISKNKKFKKAKIIKYSAKLLNSKGKVLKGKKITFKIKGKKYTAKTNKKGIATVKIKNLKAGKYKITVKYGKITSTSKITVRK